MAIAKTGPGKKIRIAHLAGPNATIQNTPPLVTSNKARAAHGLPLLTDIEGKPSRFDPLRPQKLAAPVVVYVEQFSAHPLEADVAELYAEPDGYLDAGGNFSRARTSQSDKPVFRIELSPEDGYYPMPYMARQADGSAWETDGTGPRVERAKSRQPFMPDGTRTFDEVDRLGVDGFGLGNTISNVADVDFFRLAPSGGYTKGLPAADRHGGGDIAPEVPGKDFFPYRPAHLNASPPRMTLARITNMAQEILGSGDYDGAIWTQGSPRIEETVYWFNLALDITVPICGNASQRYHGQISNDGPKNLADSVDWLHSKVWADDKGRNRAGVVMVQDQRVFAAREVTKVDARPGGYAAAGGHGGILGAGGGGTGSVLRYVPATKHTWQSEVSITKLPASVMGIRGGVTGIGTLEVTIKDARGRLLETAIPKVSIVKDASYIEDDYESDPAQEVDTIAFMEYKLKNAPLSGFVLEGLNPYGKAAASSKSRILLKAVYSGFPVVNVGRGTTEGFAIRGGPFIAGSNLTAVKARILLMLCIMKFGMLPPAKDPLRPTREEVAATEAALARYQAIFDTH
ncbi:MAG TPA: asparaginase domain-containing protein [Rhizobiaceae bacterium]|nr:asparaginase domain-containing protein [Rhizobiaceae bacterium]